MIDFDGLVLSKCEDIFSILIKVTYTVSRPEAAPMIGRGIYSSSPIDAQLQDETIFSDQQTSVGIRSRDWAIAPERGDLLEIIDIRHPAYGSRFWIGDADGDGQGGVMLMLRTQQP